MILIWDKSEPPPHNSGGKKLLWNSFQEDPQKNIYCIPRLVEIHGSNLRAQYLAYIYALGEKCFQDKRVVDYLEIRNSFSYWWMTLLAEKCNYSKSSQINDAIKLLALEVFLNQHNVENIELVTANAALVEVLQDWCDKNGVHLKCTQQLQPRPIKISLRRLYKRIPQSAQAFIWLFHRLVSHWPLAGVGIAKWRQTHAMTSFVSYLFNLVPEAAEHGKYESRYWGNLPDSMAEHGQPTRWLHVWVKDKVAPSAKVAKQLVERFNRAAETGQVHIILDCFLGLSTVWNTLVDWMGLQWRARKIESVLCKSNGTAINLWLLMHDDWQESIKGPTAMSNLLMLNLFEAAFAGIPKQKQGFYLQENQGWEFGCISAWNVSGHNQLIGVPHSTVRYWDLRYYFDSRSYHKSEVCGLPLPSRIAVNGPVAKDAYLQGGYPSEQLVDVEAIRYLHLENKDEQCNSSCDKVGKHSLLVLGEYLLENTVLQMSILEKAVVDLSAWKIVIKPHPICPIDLDDYPSLTSINASVTDQPISELLPVFNVAYTSQVTSAAVDAYCSGLSIVSALDPAVLNMSPLLGVDGVQFITNSEELIVALRNTGIQAEPKQYFYLDSDLPRWKRLLEIKE